MVSIIVSIHAIIIYYYLLLIILFASHSLHHPSFPWNEACTLRGKIHLQDTFHDHSSYSTRRTIALE